MKTPTKTPTVRVMTPGAYRVSFEFTEKKGSRNVRAGGMLVAENTNEQDARAYATARRGHLTKFVIVSVEQDYETRPMTRAEEFAAADAALKAIQAKRAQS